MWWTTRRRRARWSATLYKLHGFERDSCATAARRCATRSAKQSPDLIILDLNMPEEDGLSIVRGSSSTWRCPSSC
jgi:DNA-binding response OmpR family regulator